MNWKLRSDYKLNRYNPWVLVEMVKYSFFKTAGFAGRMYGKVKYFLKKN